MKLGDVVVLRMFKAMGLSDSTMNQIEQDLRMSANRQKTEEVKKETK